MRRDGGPDNPFDRRALRASKRDYSGMHGVGGIGGSGMGTTPA